MKTSLINYEMKYKIGMVNYSDFRLESHDGMHMVNMFWDSELEVKKFILKYEVPMINLFKVGDKVNYLPELSGLKNPLTVKSVRWATECSLCKMLKIEFEPCYIYSFEENSLGAYEKELEINKK